MRPPDNVFAVPLPIVMAPDALVVPASVIVPPVHVAAPVTLSLSAPPSVPDESVNAVALKASPLFRLAVPPLTVSAPTPTPVAPALMFNVPPVGTLVVPLAALMLYVPPDIVTAASINIVPAPLTV